MMGFLLTRNGAGLFAVAAWFGLGFSGIISAYGARGARIISRQRGVVASAGVLLFTGSGMAFGGWFGWRDLRRRRFLRRRR